MLALAPLLLLLADAPMTAPSTTPSTSTSTTTAPTPSTTPSTTETTTSPTTAAPTAERSSTTAPPPAVRVFVAPIAAGAGAEPGVVTLLEGRVLSAAKRVRGFDVIAARDVTALVDVAAVRAATGCTDGISCESEIASALNAPQLVTGELGRVGDTWLLTLARTERETSSVLMRVTVEAHGDTPEGLLARIDPAVAELFGAAVDNAPVNAAFVVGAAGLGVGVGGLLVGAVAAVWSSWHFDETKAALADAADPDARDAIRADAVPFGETLNAVAIGGFIVGGAAAAVGVAGLVVDAVSGGE